MENQDDAKLKRQAELAEKRAQRRAAEYVPLEEQLRRAKEFLKSSGVLESLKKMVEKDGK